MIKVNYKEAESTRETMLMWLLHAGAPLYFYWFFNQKAKPFNPDGLLKYPAQSLGHELGLFYRRNRIEPLSGLLGHDLLHVILGYATNVQDEVKLQFFLFGNGKRSFSTLAAIGASILIFPERIGGYYAELRKGKSFQKIWGYNFGAMLACNITDIKNKTFKIK